MIAFENVPVIVKEMKHCLGLDSWSAYNPGLRTCIYHRNYVFFESNQYEIKIWNYLAREGFACKKGTCYFITKKGIEWLESVLGVSIYSADDDPERAKENIASFEISFPWDIKVNSSDFEEVREEIEAYFMNLIPVDDFGFFDIDELSVQLKNGEEVYE